MRAHTLEHSTGRLKKQAWLFLLLAGVLVPLAAQTALYVQDGAEARLVQAFLHERPLVEKNGKLVEPSGTRCALEPVDEYLPIHIAVRDWDVHASELGLVGTGDTLNKTISMGGELESPTDLDRVFLVVELTSQDRGKLLFGWEVGRLAAHESTPFSLRLPLSAGIGQGNYRVHFFVNGHEVFNSMMPMGTMDNAIQRMVQKRIEGVKDAEPRLFICTAPEYPKALRKAKENGSVTVTFRIIANGSVLDPQVDSATNPALIGPTLAAVRQWYFLPRIRNGRPVETTVKLPVNLAPPAK
jgi:TonB family protein